MTLARAFVLATTLATIRPLAAAPRSGGPAGPKAHERHRKLYDKGCLFSPEGRVYAVEYAQRAVARGSFAAGAVAPDGVALAAVRSSAVRGAPDAFCAANWRERARRPSGIETR